MKYFSLFAFLVLMTVKVSALHIYSHQDVESDKIEECSFCELAIENQSDEVFLSDFPEVRYQLFYCNSEPSLLFVQGDFSNTTKNLHLFLRPPPTL